MSVARGAVTPTRRAFVPPPRALLRMTCACGCSNEEPFDPKTPIKKQLAEASCLSCGALGQMKEARNT